MKNTQNLKKKLIMFVISLLMALLPLTSGIQVKASSVYYVSTSGNDSNSGTSTGSAWKTIAHAATQAQAGDTVYIQAGNYGHEQVVFSNSGTSIAPIEFVGCDSSWNPIPGPEYYDIYSTSGIATPDPDSSAMPYIDGSDKTDNGITAADKSYITIKNIQVASYRNGISIEDSCDHIILNNVRVYWCYEENIRLFAPDYCQILNSIAHGAGMGDIAVGGAQNCLIENCLATDNAGHHQNEPDTETDYYIHLTSQVTGSTGRESKFNTVRHCLAFNAHENPHGVHGIVLKSMFDATVHDNLVEDCVSNTMASNFQLRHSNVYDNTIKDCIAYDLGITSTVSGAFECRDGAHDNTFINCRGRHVSGTNTSNGVYMYDSVENSMGDVNGDDTYSGYGNKFYNCTFEDYTFGINFGYWSSGYDSPACNNVFENCNFIDNNYSCLIRNESANNNNNVMTNCIVTGYDAFVTGNGSGSFTYSYSCFNNNVFAAPAGTGIITSDPLFADAANRDYHLRSQYGRWNGSEWVNDASTSPCIDAGDPASICSDEPAPNGGRINIGAYGNTAEASKSSWYGKLAWTDATHSLGSSNCGTVTIEFDVKPLQNNMDSDIGFTDSSVTPDDYSDLCMIFEMDTSGYFKAVNYDNYAALTAVPYSANNIYHVKMVGNLSTRTYDAWVTPAGGSETMIADDYRFRSNGPAIDDVGIVCTKTSTADEDYYLTNLAISASSSTPTWYGKLAWTSATHFLGSGNCGTVTIEFDVKPLQNNMDSDIGFTDSSVTPDDYSDLCMIFEMDTSGYFKALNYYNYTALTAVPYAANNTYHVKMVGNLWARIYDAWVTPSGGSEAKIADDYGFRINGPLIDDVGIVCTKTSTADEDYYITNLTISH